MRARGDDGQALPLVLVIVAPAVGAMFLLGALGQRALAGARAQTAADAAALAGAVEGPEAAADLAALNGSVTADVEGGVGDAPVSVRVGEADATARAEAPPPVGGAGADGLTPAMAEAVARAGALLGRPVPISSGFRSYAEQAALWAARFANPYPTSPPYALDRSAVRWLDPPKPTRFWAVTAPTVNRHIGVGVRIGAIE